MRTAKRPSPPSDSARRPRVQRQTISADSERLSEVCDWVRLAAEDSGFDDRTSYACQLAVCEAVENVIQHGFRADRHHELTVETRSRPGTLIVEITDDAPPFDPTMVPPPGPEDAGVGGRGILMINRVMDKIHYERRKGQNVLRLTKNRAFTGA